MAQERPAGSAGIFEERSGRSFEQPGAAVVFFVAVAAELLAAVFAGVAAGWVGAVVCAVPGSTAKARARTGSG